MMIRRAERASLIANEPPPLPRRNYEQMPLNVSVCGATVEVFDGDLLHAEGAYMLR
jgi:hypothetical protein